MNDRSLSTLTIFGFVILGTICLGLRSRSIERDEAAREDSTWELTCDAHFEALNAKGDQEIQVRFAVPFDTRHCRLLHEDSFTSNPNLNAKLLRPNPATGNRMLSFSTRQAATAPFDAHAKFVLRLSPRPNSSQPNLESLGSRDRFLRPELDLPTAEPSVRQIAQLLPADRQTDFDRLQWVFNYCSEIDSGGNAQPSDDAQIALTTKHGSAKAQARAMVTLCRVLGFPARLVTGFIIRQGANIQPHVWAEVFQNQEWVPFDPANGYSLNLPLNYVPVRRDATQAHSSQNVTGLTMRYSIKRLPPDTRLAQAEVHHPLQILSLTRLPLKMHNVMKILLLLPFAALITTIIRNVVGVGTFGTFSPALLAMSFIYADWKTGLAILLMVIMVGLIGRASLERLRLLTVPRLSIILTGVVLCVVFGVSTLHYMVPAISAEVVLLPMIILTNLIERFHVSADEDGIAYTVKLAVGTLFVALLCYLVLMADRVGNFVLTYPEAHFFTIAVFIMLGRYAGYRLTELWRFRDLVDSGEAAR
ncbi:MAG: hypothetical protein IT427_12900 [Pirellulales bacterium]|jgi:hypothetical protein|nr:hypothetical protein [Pirellulales bacterium]